MSREEWIRFGEKIKRARALLMEIDEEHRQLSGQGKVSAFSQAIIRLDRAKWKLESWLGTLKPEWDDVSRFFSGSAPPHS